MNVIPSTVIGAVVAFLYGIVVGSFLNVCIYRLPLGESLISPPSHCPNCHTRLKPQDLFPLFSYLWLGRKCRYCKVPISPRYFTIELITGLLFTICFFALVRRYPQDALGTAWWGMLILLWIFVSAMLVTFMIDLNTTYVIEPVTWIAMGAGLLFELLSYSLQTPPTAHPYHFGGIPIPAALPGIVVGFMVFVVMDQFGRLIFRKPSMGLGDAFIGAAIGAMLGTGLALISFGVAVLLCVVISIPLLISGALQRSVAPGAEEARAPGNEEPLPQGLYIPFGPFLTASAVCVALAPNWVFLHAGACWHWWLHLFG
jgi:leader peptidase (prepilin peptidase)/N-methyltransferase